jgi:hypothetical protein
MLTKITGKDGKPILCLIDFDELERINKYADQNEINIDEYSDIVNKRKLCVGDRKEYTYITEYFKFVISIDHAPLIDYKKICKIKRMTASLNVPNRFPSVGLLSIIMKHLHFSEFEKCNIVMNKDDVVPHIEVNYIIETRDLSEEEAEKWKRIVGV